MTPGSDTANHALPAWRRADHAGTLQLSLREEFLAGASTGNAAVVIDDGGDERFPTATVPVERLDDLPIIRDADVAVIKLDVEGHEDRVLRGGMSMLRRARPTVIAE